MSSIFPPIDPVKATSAMEVRVRFAETDLMGIVHHSSYLLYFEAGRVEWLRSRGVTYADWAAKGVHLPVVDVNVSYKSPARFDDLVTVETALTELRSASLKFGYRVKRGDQLLVVGETRLACIDDASNLLRIPEPMRDVLLAAPA
ncbi:MAG: acyl-CoA thioesterase [Labilithrix sp.]|nr:acyl-CoA thioesterase [Labilithrix sp.]MCW5811085.1 acyl-CoA thioesterase [Labilithrix sp.]